MADFLPPVVATLLADTKEFTAKMDEAQGKMGKFGAESEAAGNKFTSFANKASTAVIGLGAAITAYGVDRAFKFQESLDAIQNQANTSANELNYLKGQILSVSDQTAISSDQISQAYLQAEKAGNHYAAATNLVRNAAKASVVTGEDVVSMAQSIIAAQTLQVAKGMSVAQITGEMVAANKLHLGSMDSLVAILKGRVGATLAEYGVNLHEAAAIADVASRAGLTHARSLTSMGTALAKLENPTSATNKSLAKIGLTASSITSTLKQPNGLIDVISQLTEKAREGGTPISTYMNAVFGAQGGATATALSKNLGALTSINSQLSAAGGNSLKKSFQTATEQMGFQLHHIETQIGNDFTRIGLALLPKVETAIHWGEELIQWFQQHPLVSKIASEAAIGVFATSVVYKLGMGLAGVFGKITSLFGGGKEAVVAEQMTTQTGYLADIAANTTAMAEKMGVATATNGAESVATGAGGLLLGGGRIALGAGRLAGVAASAPELTAMLLGNLLTSGSDDYSTPKSLTSLTGQLQAAGFGNNQIQSILRAAIKNGMTDFMVDKSAKTFEGFYKNGTNVFGYDVGVGQNPFTFNAKNYPDVVKQFATKKTTTHKIHIKVVK